MLRQSPGVLTLAILAACTAMPPPRIASQSADELMGPAEFRSLPSRPADHRIAYGDDPNQYADLSVPSTAGPHPVVILIHGGCWKADYATLRGLAPMADALKADGIASWNIEYRRIPQPGSGWPGTYADVGRATDHLRVIAQKYRLDLDRVVVLGHSAGGHLAMWVAARSRLPAKSQLHVADPLPISGVVDLAGAGDLEAFIPVQMTACRDPNIVKTLLGGEPAAAPERYAQTSAMRMLPLAKRQILIWGQRDEMTPVWLGEAYADAARKAGDSVRLEVLPSLGHFEIADPASPAWPVVHEAIGSLLKPGH
ncbi:alpha/beta hydrolase family protein [Lysobacter antibioticus]|uniref:alpha/beta hydrolase family protein n=1 Tax=Lysobacter antibioticus TaxID=84531 RepID=UPI001F3341AF|nr:alpha/beta hydrolase [Lysobacter antibioticus]